MTAKALRRCAAPLAIALCCVSGCHCDGETDGATGSSTQPSGATSSVVAAPIAPPKVPVPAPWTFKSVRNPTGIAPPAQCRLQTPLLAASVDVSTHFGADIHSRGTLLVAETKIDPPSVLRSGFLSMSADGKVTPGEWAPWPSPRSAPRVARSDKHWVYSWTVPGEDGTSEVVLYRASEAESLGRGDAYAVADLACGKDRCALLTSRRGRVAPAGALVHLFDPSSRVPPMTISIEPEGESAARPFGLTGVDAKQGPIAVLADNGEAVFWNTQGEGAPASFAKVKAEYGLLDATLLGDRPLVMAHGNAVDDRGCAGEGSDARGSKVLFSMAGEAPKVVRSPGPPALAALRPMGSGALSVWVSPLGCGAERHVVYSVLLDSNGSPVSEPIPVGDGETFVLSVEGSGADLWLRHADRIAWVRLSCDLGKR